MPESTECAVHDSNVSAVEDVLRLWVDDPEVIFFCGAWNNGAIMELLPRGKARLTGQLYAGRFTGLRDLILDDGGHHVHLDLGRLNRVCYIVAPSVCFGFRPSFELRIAAPDADPMREFGLGIALRHPYEGKQLREAAATRYFSRAIEHLRVHPSVVSLTIRPRGAYDTDHEADWSAIDRLLSKDASLLPLRQFLPAAMKS